MIRKTQRWIPRLAWLAAGLIIINAPLATAEDGPSPEVDGTPVDETRRQLPRPTAAGLTVFIDPETGEVTDRPNAERRAALAEALRGSLNKSSQGLETFELIHGGHGVRLEGRFRSAIVARLRPDGSFEIGCVDHPDEAAVLTISPPPATTPEWEEK